MKWPKSAKILHKASNSLEVSHSLSPQSSGKVERAKRVLNETLTKLTIELHQDWTKLLPLALLKVQALPKNPLNISPFEAMYQRLIVPLGLSLPRTVPNCHPTFLFPYLPRYEMPFGNIWITYSLDHIPISCTHPSKWEKSLYDSSVPLRSNPKMARTLQGNSPDPYCCKIKRNHPLGAHYLTKKDYAAQWWECLWLILTKFLTEALQL